MQRSGFPPGVNLGKIRRMPSSPDLASEIAALPQDLAALLERHQFERARLLALGARLAGNRGAAHAPDNRVQGDVRAPAPNELRLLPEPGSAEHTELAARGRALLEQGQVAFCVMAGGMATRMGGVVKALVSIWPGMRFLDFRLAEARTWATRYGSPVPLWLMTSDATDGPLREALAEVRRQENPEQVAALTEVHTFPQALSLRLREDGSLYRSASGAPSPYATGHGDLVDSLRASGLCARFVQAGGKYVWIANLDNLGATLDEAMLGYVDREGAKLAVEVCDKEAGDRGGIPVHTAGKLQVLEEFRLPVGFDADSVRSFNTNTFLASAESLQNTRFSWTYFEVTKKVDGESVIQSERLLQEMTAHLDTLYLRVPRAGVASRFLPVKDMTELAARRPVLQELARTRGLDR